MDIQDFLNSGERYFLPNLSLDFVIIGYENSKLKCLLLKNNDQWFLPGGFVRKNQSVSDAANEILHLRTKIENPHFKFLDVFGDVNRTFSHEWKLFCEKNGYSWNQELWVNKRFISLAHYALVDIKNSTPTVSFFDEDFYWFEMNNLPNMGLDHEHIVKRAKKQLQEDVKHNMVTHNLLPRQFTMPQLHKLHQIILEEKLDRSRFQKKMLASGLYDRLPELQKETPGRNPYLYQIKE
ncbi:NUDIX hydrolase [Neptunitalea lumnitzerae]|uniref:NUDIX hydrolase n=1 Tax=Neptunitalea lumnitzerae TaxID=2965509 RepID=A0ABQ5MJK4_9FLAO|nr:hypothetical protein [Neptunitalea sp. Y10]GLB49574.1 NUDIX hydrolase [Neptunitalea sp. Y10]